MDHTSVLISNPPAWLAASWASPGLGRLAEQPETTYEGIRGLSPHSDSLIDPLYSTFHM
jgi:hypothetical protein